MKTMLEEMIPQSYVFSSGHLPAREPSPSQPIYRSRKHQRCEGTAHERTIRARGRQGRDGINNPGAMVLSCSTISAILSISLLITRPSSVEDTILSWYVRQTNPSAHIPAVSTILSRSTRRPSTCISRTARMYVVANADLVKSLQSGQTLSVNAIIKVESAPPITGNSAMIGAFAKSAGIPWETVGEVFRRHMPKAADENIRVARRAYDQIRQAGTGDLRPDTQPALRQRSDRAWPGRRRPFYTYLLPDDAGLNPAPLPCRKCRAARDNGDPPGNEMGSS